MPWGAGVRQANSAPFGAGGWGGLGVSGIIGDTMLPLCRPEHGGTIPPASSVFESVEGEAPRDEALGGETMVGQTQLVDKLRELARNLWWTWQPNVIALFRELDPALWRKVDHNPVEFLKLSAGRAARAAGRRDGARLANRLRIPPAGRVPAGHRFVGRGPRLDPAAAAGRLLLGRVRAAREPADLFGRPGRAGR